MLEVRELSFRYRRGGPCAVDGLSFAVGAGEVVGLLGPNGAGKTTVMSLIAGLRRPATGVVRLADEARSRRGFALVPQEFAFYPMLTCRENLAFFGAVLGSERKASRERIEYVLERAGLDRVAEKRAAECSGGIRRRLNLGIGLMGDPKLLLLDEPTAGVDPQSRAFLLDTIRALRGEGRAVLYSSHYLEEVQAIADRVVVIDHGRMLRSGAMAELLRQGSAVVRVAVQPGPTAGDLAELRGRFSLLAGSEGEAGELVFATEGGIDLERILAELRARALEVRRFHFGGRSLEDVFLELTRRDLRD